MLRKSLEQFDLVKRPVSNRKELPRRGLCCAKKEFGVASLVERLVRAEKNYIEEGYLVPIKGSE